MHFHAHSRDGGAIRRKGLKPKKLEKDSRRPKPFLCQSFGHVVRITGSRN